jgi:excisionase family DNA binding protein
MPDLSPKEAAQVMNIHVQTMWRLLRLNVIRHYHIGRSVRIRVEVLTAYREGQRALDGIDVHTENG